MPSIALPAAPEAVFRIAPLPAAAPLSEREAAALDDVAGGEGSTQRRPGAAGHDEAETRLALQGMHCAACAGLIEAALLSEPGVLAARVQAATERAWVRWDPQHTRLSLLVNAVRRAGYGAQPAGGDEAAQARLAESRRALWRLFVAAFCMMQVMMVATPLYVAGPGEITPDLTRLLQWSAWVLSLPVLLFASQPFFAGAWRALRQGRIGMDVPVALGIAITFVASTGATFDPQGPFGSETYFDSLTMFVSFLLAGRWLELRARAHSARALETLTHGLPDSVERLLPDGGAERVAIARLRPGDRVRVVVGQAFPADGCVLEGRTEADEALLSGESRPLVRGPGDPVVAGSFNLVASVVMRVDKLGTHTRRAQILALMERAMSERPALLRAADRIATPFLVGVLLLAGGAWLAWQVIDPSRALWVAVSVLIVTCPCALSLAAPSALLSASGALARRGVLVQRLEALEALATIDLAAFDKTGTLTAEAPALRRVEVMPRHGSPAATGTPLHATAARAAVAQAAALAAHAQHPLSRALVAHRDATAASDGPAAAPVWTQVEELAGRGLEASDAKGRRWRLGAAAWAAGSVASTPSSAPEVVLAPCDGTGPALRFVFDEALRPEAHALVEGLQGEGVPIALLSGDRPGAVAAAADALGVADWRAGLTPDGKLEALRAWQAQGRRVLMVGDGLNDAPVLAQADVSIALGHGAALAQQRADLVVLGSHLQAIVQARRLARQAMRAVRQNFAWAVFYNAVAVPLAVMGWLPPWAAGLGMALSSLFVVGNAWRLTVRD